MDLKNLNIAIVGAGYGGAAVAKALSLLGADVTVYEQATEIREVGAGIGLRPSTMDRFRRLGIFDAIAAVSSPSDYFEILTAPGDPIAEGRGRGWTTTARPHHLIHRGDFIDALVGVLPEGHGQPRPQAREHRRRRRRGHPQLHQRRTVDADLVIGADGIKSPVRQQLFSRPAAGVRRRARLPRGDRRRRHLRHGVDDNLRMYIGRGTKVYLLPLLHRGRCPSTSPPSTPTAPGRRRSPRRTSWPRSRASTSGSCRRPRPRHGHGQRPRRLRHRPRRHVALRLRRAPSATRRTRCAPPGTGRELRDPGRRRPRRRPPRGRLRRRRAAAFQAARKPVTDELQRISRQGWSEDEVEEVFPGQKPGQVAATGG